MQADKAAEILRGYHRLQAAKSAAKSASNAVVRNESVSEHDLVGVVQELVSAGNDFDMLLNLHATIMPEQMQIHEQA